MLRRRRPLYKSYPVVVVVVVAAVVVVITCRFLLQLVYITYRFISLVVYTTCCFILLPADILYCLILLLVIIAYRFIFCTSHTTLCQYNCSMVNTVLCYTADVNYISCYITTGFFIFFITCRFISTLLYITYRFTSLLV